jgi:hypothetical protein
MRRSVVLGCVLAVASQATVLAQPADTPPLAPPGATEPAPLPAAEIPQPAENAPRLSETPAEHLARSDAASGRAFLSPTAFTAPKGAAGAEAWLPAYPGGILAAASYAITSRIEIAGGGLAVDKDSAGYLSAKLALIRRPSFGVAVQVQYLGRTDATDDSLTFLSAVASKCFRDCRAVISAHVTAFPTQVMATDFGPAAGTHVHVVPGASLVYGGRTKLVIDAVGWEDSPDHGIGLYAGARLARHRWSLDGGFAAFDDGDDAKVIPLPLIAGSLRF